LTRLPRWRDAIAHRLVVGVAEKAENVDLFNVDDFICTRAVVVHVGKCAPMELKNLSIVNH
jgi:hypothetical protein